MTTPPDADPNGLEDTLASDALGVEQTAPSGGGQDRAVAEAISDRMPVFRPGDRVGRHYVVERMVGAGGMGQVYVAQDEVLLRSVAIKLLHPSVGEQLRAEARVRREARHLSRLQHPNAVFVFEFGREDSGACWFAMEYVDGVSLAARLREQTPTPLQAAHVIAQTADVLDAAHRVGVVHRDIKPENLLIRELSGDAWFVKVTDFGIAQRAAAEDEEVDSLLHMAVGTVRYMAPEQIRAEPLDGRADVYALGIVAYELLTGHHPFESHTGMSMLSAHLTEPPPRATVLAHELPEAVDVVLLQALAKDRADRFATAGDFATALRNALGQTSAVQTPERASATPPAASVADWRALGVIFGRVEVRRADGRRLYRGEEAELVELMSRRVQQRLTEHGGTLVTWAAGEWLAVLTHDGLREELAAATIDAALSTRAALRRLSTDPVLDAPVHIDVTLGVDVGLVMGSFGASTPPLLTGGPVTRALALRRAAACGAVDVDLRTLRTVAGFFTSSPGPSPDTRSIEARAAIDAGGDSRLRPAADEAPLQGRALELAQVQRAASIAADEQRVQVVVVTGPAGVGKSRVIREALFQLSDTEPALTVQSSHCSPAGVGGAWEPVNQVLTRLCGGKVSVGTLREVLARAGDATPTASAAVLARVAGASSTARAAADASPGVDGDRAAAVAAFCGLMAGTDEQPLVVFVVEDVHWASSETWFTLKTMVREVADRPVLILLEMRSDGTLPDLGLPLDQLTMVRLATLSDAEVDALTMALVPDLEEVPEALLATVRGAAAGLAVHVEELVAAWRSSGALGGPTASTDALAGTIDETVLARIDGLSDPERLAVRRHAVLGDGAPLDLLFDEGGAESRRVLGRLRAAGLLRDQRGGAGQVTTRFRHALVREVVYRNLAPSWRRAEHGRAADWYLDQDQPTAVADQLLCHCLGAGRHGEAAEAAVSAARQALTAMATDRALGLLRTAVEASQASDHSDCAIEARREAYLMAARVCAFQRLPEEGARWLLQAGTDDLAGRSHAFLARVSVARAVGAELEGRFEDALLHVDDAERLATDGPDPDSTVLALLWSRRAMLLARTGQRDGARAAARTAIEHAESSPSLHDPELCASLGTAHAALGRAAASETGRLSEALGHHHRARDAWRRAGYPVGEAVALLHLGNVSWRGGDLDSAATCWRDAQDRYMAAGALRGVALVSTNLGELELRRGDPKAALEQLQQARGTLESLGVKDALVEATRLVAQAHAELADLDAAVVAARQATDLSQSVKRPDYAGAAWMTLGEVYAARGEASDAATAFAAARSAFEQAGAIEQAAAAAEREARLRG